MLRQHKYGTAIRGLNDSDKVEWFRIDRIKDEEVRSSTDLLLTVWQLSSLCSCGIYQCIESVAVSLSGVDFLDKEVDTFDMVMLINSERVVHLRACKGNVLRSPMNGDSVIRRHVWNHSARTDRSIVVGGLFKTGLKMTRRR